jgi:hypothetical protein
MCCKCTAQIMKNSSFPVMVFVLLERAKNLIKQERRKKDVREIW